MCQKKYTAKGGQHVHKVLQYVNLKLSFLNTHNVPLRKMKSCLGWALQWQREDWLIFSNIFVRALSKWTHLQPDISGVKNNLSAGFESEGLQLTLIFIIN